MTRRRRTLPDYVHNVGLLALLDFYSPEYRDLLAVSDPDPPSILEAERKLFDINHCEADTWLCGYWNLPSTIEAVVGHHHDQEPKRGSRLALVVASTQAVGSGLPSPYRPYWSLPNAATASPIVLRFSRVA